MTGDVVRWSLRTAAVLGVAVATVGGVSVGAAQATVITGTLRICAEQRVSAFAVVLDTGLNSPRVTTGDCQTFRLRLKPGEQFDAHSVRNDTGAQRKVTFTYQTNIRGFYANDFNFTLDGPLT